MQERRQNVRVRPAADYNIQVDFEDGLVKVELSVLDAAVGGVALVVDELFAGATAGSFLKLGVTLPDHDRFITSARLCYTQGKARGRCGMHFSNLTDAQQSAMGKAVSELLERGHSA